MENNKPPILEFENVVLEAGEHFEAGLLDVTFQLRPGDLLLALLDREHFHVSLADAASGLVTPTSGAVRFKGRDWRDLRADKSAVLRGRISRLFDENYWIANLDMDENLLLSESHHTQRPASELREEASDLARRFGLPGLPLGSSGNFVRQDLRKAACVRAFMGQPELILLERPTHAIYADVMAPLVNAVYEARRRGAAVVWSTEDRQVWDDAGLNPTTRVLISGARMHACETNG